VSKYCDTVVKDNLGNRCHR